MTTGNNILHDIEREMIQNDTLFYLRLYHHLYSTARTDSGILILSLIPYFALFVVESFNYFQKTDPVYAQSVQRKYKDILENSRNQIKLFDEKYRQVTGMIDFIEEITKAHYKYFILKHTGLLANLKRQLQCDLGLYKIEDHVFCTSHVAHFNAGYAPQVIETDMRTLSKAIGVDIGEYMRLLYNDFGLQGRQSVDGVFHYTISPGSIELEDVKTEKYYTSGFNDSLSANVNSAITLFMATINFLNYVLPRIVKTPTDTILKMKYINIYHVVSSLKQLRTTHDTALTTISKGYLDIITNDADLNFIISQVQFRNIVVHYGIRNINESQIDRSLRFYGLVERFFPGYSFETLNEIVDRQIYRIANLLEEWKSKN